MRKYQGQGHHLEAPHAGIFDRDEQIEQLEERRRKVCAQIPVGVLLIEAVCPERRELRQIRQVVAQHNLLQVIHGGHRNTLRPLSTKLQARAAWSQLCNCSIHSVPKPKLLI